MSSLPELPGYSIERELGRGGMARVYLATQTSLRRKVALKVLEQEATESSEMAERFEREAHTLAGLNHQNIVAVHDIGHCELRHFLAMEYLPGGSLADRLRLSRPPLQESLSLLAQLANALGHAHAAGIVHRDVKPDNILFRDSATPVLADFGIARPLDGSAVQLTEKGMAIGTPAYMSPEQIEGQPVDGRTDLYALGVMFHELLTGQLPFAGSSTDVLAGHLIRKPPDLPIDLAALQPVLDRLMAKSPSARYANAGDLLTDCRERLLTSPDLLAKLESVPGSSPSERLHVLGFNTNGGHVIAATARLAAQQDSNTTRATSSRRVRIIGLTAMLGALALIGVNLWPVTAPTPVLQAATTSGTLLPAAGSELALAVLPFANLSTDPEQAFFSDGLSEELIRVLSGLKGLRVSARASAFQFKDKPDDPKIIANKLGVDYLLTGSVRRAGTRLRIGAELLRVADGQVLWQQSFERQLSAEAVFAIQDGIARAVANELPLALRLPPEQPLISGSTHDLAAYEDYLRGRQAINQGGVQSRHAALALFQSAATRDPGFALALIGSADAMLLLAQDGAMPRAEALAQAQAALARAEALGAGDSAEAWAAKGWRAYLNGDPQQAEQALQRALVLNPHYLPALFRYATLLEALGRDEEALALRQRALALDPLNLTAQVNYATGLMFRGDFSAAGAVCAKLLRQTPEAFAAQRCEIRFRSATGELAAALARLARALQLSPKDGWALGTAALQWLDLDDAEAAAAWIALDPAGADLTLAQARATLAWQHGKVDAAADQLGALLRQETDGIFFQSVLAELELARGGHAAVLSLLARRFPADAAPRFGRSELRAALAHAHALQALGEAEQARAWLQAIAAKAADWPKRGDKGVRLAEVEALTLLGRVPEALDRLDALAAEGVRPSLVSSLYLPERNPHLAALREQPRFQAWLAAEQAWRTAQRALAAPYRFPPEEPAKAK